MPTKVEHIVKIKEEKREIRETAIKGKLAENLIDQLEEKYETVVKQIISKGANGEVSVEDVANTLNAQKSLIDARESIESFNKVMHSVQDSNSNKLTTEEKERIVTLHETGMFSQDELAYTFGTSQPTIHRIIKK